MTTPPFSIDFFSYWIFGWFLCYQIGATKYNPFSWLCIALFIGIIAIFYMFFFQNDWLNISLFCLEYFIIKVCPILLLWGSVIRWNDFQAGLLLFVCIYIPYLAWNRKLIYPTNPYFKSLYLISKNQPATSFVRFMRFHVQCLLRRCNYIFA